MANGTQASLLFYCVYHQLKELTRQLIYYGTPPNAGTTNTSTPAFNNMTPLMQACINKDVDTIQMLLDAGADLLCVTGNGKSVLMKIKSLELNKQNDGDLPVLVFGCQVKWQQY